MVADYFLYERIFTSEKTGVNKKFKKPLDKLPFVWYIILMMNDKCKCEDCGAPVKWEYEAPFQEYAGAKVWGGEWFVECEKCGWSDATKQDLSNYSIRENTRGW